MSVFQDHLGWKIFPYCTNADLCESMDAHLKRFTPFSHVKYLQNDILLSPGKEIMQILTAILDVSQNYC